MLSDFQLAEYEREHRAAMQKVGACLLLGGVAFGGLVALHLAPAWLVLVVLLLVLAYGVIYPVRWRREHHPFRLEARERRYSMALLLGRSVGFASLMVAASCWDMSGAGPHHAAIVTTALTFLSFTFPIFMDYKP